MVEGAKDMTQESVIAGSVQPKLSREEQRLDKGVVSSVQQGFDASAETVGTYQSGFTPKTFTAEEQTFKSSATAKPSLVSMQTGVSVDVIAEIFSDLWHHL